MNQVGFQVYTGRYGNGPGRCGGKDAATWPCQDRIGPVQTDTKSGR
jgi:hypothetical protein